MQLRCADLLKKNLTSLDKVIFFLQLQTFFNKKNVKQIAIDSNKFKQPDRIFYGQHPITDCQRSLKMVTTTA